MKHINLVKKLIKFHRRILTRWSDFSIYKERVLANLKGEISNRNRLTFLMFVCKRQILAEKCCTGILIHRSLQVDPWQKRSLKSQDVAIFFKNPIFFCTIEESWWTNNKERWKWLTLWHCFQNRTRSAYCEAGTFTLCKIKSSPVAARKCAVRWIENCCRAFEQMMFRQLEFDLTLDGSLFTCQKQEWGGKVKLFGKVQISRKVSWRLIHLIFTERYIFVSSTCFETKISVCWPIYVLKKNAESNGTNRSIIRLPEVLVALISRQVIQFLSPHSRFHPDVETVISCWSIHFFLFTFRQ